MRHRRTADDVFIAVYLILIRRVQECGHFLLIRSYLLRFSERRVLSFDFCVAPLRYTDS